MAKKGSNKNIPAKIRPFIWGYIYTLEKQGIPIQKAYLFGSWAKGKQHKWSDVDLAIISSSPKFKTWGRRINALHKAKRSEDFVDIEAHGFHAKDFDPSENPVAYEAIKHGIRLI